MKKLLFLCLLSVLSSLIFAQKALIIENQTIGKSFKFFVGDEISLLTRNNPHKISGKISDIYDSSIVISNNYVFDQSQITVVFKGRYGVQIISTLLMSFGAIFIFLDVVNNVINNDHPKIRTDTSIISASSIASGGFLWLFSKRKCPINKNKWRIKIIDTIHVKSK
ncbi:MAG: hypothetical protein WCQ95_01220 [Bacteroidota bacterium]